MVLSASVLWREITDLDIFQIQVKELLYEVPVARHRGLRSILKKIFFAVSLPITVVGIIFSLIYYTDGVVWIFLIWFGVFIFLKVVTGLDEGKISAHNNYNRRTDPFPFWFLVIFYGSLSFLAVGFAAYSLITYFLH